MPAFTKLKPTPVLNLLGVFVFMCYLNTGRAFGVNKQKNLYFQHTVNATDPGFNAIYDGNKTFFNWHQVGTNSADYFVIEKSNDGTHFSAVLMVKGAGQYAGNMSYSDVDYSSLQTLTYYRLKQTDHEGHVLFSGVVPVNFQFNKDGSAGTVKSTLPDASDMKKLENKEVLVLLRDTKGNEVTTKVLVEQNNATLFATPQSPLDKGSYTVLASSANVLYAKNLVIR